MLTGPEQKELLELMLACFRDYDSLEQVLSFMEPSVNLNRFSSKARDMEDVCFDVLKEFDRQEQFGLLLAAIRNESPDLKKFCTRHLTPRPESNAGNEGEALQYLCNRLAQEMDFSSRFSSQSAATQVYFLPGPDGAMHPSFVRRLQDWTLPELLKMRGENPDGTILRVASPWVQSPPKGNEGPFLQQKLAGSLGRTAVIQVTGDAAPIKQHPKLAGRIVIVEHTLYAKWWNEAMVALLADYLHFWSAPVPAVDRPARFLIFFHVVFPVDSEPAPILAALDKLAQEANAETCGVIRLEPLHCVEREHVDDWINTYLSDRRYEGDQLLNELFQSGSCLPMNKVEPRLQEFVNE
jgi:hypothetical protein